MTLEISTRDAYGKALVEIGEKHKTIIVLDADDSKSTRTIYFSKKYPKRFIDVGCAEQNLVGIAAGISLTGLVPIISAKSIFICGRAFEQIRNTIAFSNLNVKIAASHSGLSAGMDGPTHFSIEDIGLMRLLPNMIVINPCDAIETKKALIAAINIDGPVYIRLSRLPVPIITKENDVFEIGKVNVLRNGEDITIVSCGAMMHRAIITGLFLKEKGFRAEIINVHTIKPLDHEALLNSVKKTKCLLSIEDHSKYCGLGSSLSEFFSTNYPIPIKILAIEDTFAESGNTTDLLDKYGLSIERSVEISVDIINLKRKWFNYDKSALL